MGTHIFVIEKVLLNFFTVPLIVLFISSTSAPKNKSKRRALFSEGGVVVLLRRCSGTGEYETEGKKS